MLSVKNKSKLFWRRPKDKNIVFCSVFFGLNLLTGQISVLTVVKAENVQEYTSGSKTTSGFKNKSLFFLRMIPLLAAPPSCTHFLLIGSLLGSLHGSLSTSSCLFPGYLLRTDPTSAWHVIKAQLVVITGLSWWEYSHELKWNWNKIDFFSRSAERGLF